MIETYQFYTTEVTSKEAALGFIRAVIVNPSFEFMGHGSLTEAVILPLGKGDIIIKMIDPDGKPSYSHQQYGNYGTVKKDDGEWQPLATAFPDAEITIKAARSGMDAKPPIGMKVTMTTPKIELQCPKCTEEFEVEADFLPIDAMQTCKCGHSASNDEFNKMNV